MKYLIKIIIISLLSGIVSGCALIKEKTPHKLSERETIFGYYPPFFRLSNDLDLYISYYIHSEKIQIYTFIIFIQPKKIPKIIEYDLKLYTKDGAILKDLSEKSKMRSSLITKTRFPYSNYSKLTQKYGETQHFVDGGVVDIRYIDNYLGFKQSVHFDLFTSIPVNDIINEELLIFKGKIIFDLDGKERACDFTEKIIVDREAVIDLLKRAREYENK